MFKGRSEIFNIISKRKGQIAVLIDPEKVEYNESFQIKIEKIEKAGVSFIFVGGSTVTQEQQSRCISAIKELTNLPVVIFPGSHEQIDNHADAVLFLNLISGRNADFLIEHHIAAVPKLIDSQLEIIPTAYLIIDGGVETMVQKVSKTEAIRHDQFELVWHTAVAGVMMGNILVYLDAGSGAEQSVPVEWINFIANQIERPLIVGGGIRSIEKIQAYTDAGAHIIVVGNHIESKPEFLEEIADFCKTTI